VIADAAAAVLDRILLAVILDWGVIRDVTCGELEIAAVELPETGDLPSADQRVQQTARIAAEQLSLSERQVNQKVPVHPMLGNGRVPPVIQQPVARGVISGNLPRQVKFRGRL